MTIRHPASGRQYAGQRQIAVSAFFTARGVSPPSTAIYPCNRPQSEITDDAIGLATAQCTGQDCRGETPAMPVGENSSG